MENAKEHIKGLQSLDWHDFSRYPENGASIVVYASGFDTVGRKWIHKFVKVADFSPFDFPSEDILRELKQFHAKWNYKWLLLEDVEGFM